MNTATDRLTGTGEDTGTDTGTNTGTNTEPRTDPSEEDGAGFSAGFEAGVEAGFEAGFEELFDRYFEQMKRLAYLLGADDPENIAQEAFVRLHGRWRAVMSGAGRPVPYLRRTVANLSRSRLRHLRVVRRAPREPTVFGEPAAVSAEAQVLSGATQRAVRDALATLTDRQRQVLVLRYWLDLEQTQIAETLGIAAGTVRATTSQALANLRKVLPGMEVE